MANNRQTVIASEAWQSKRLFLGLSRRLCLLAMTWMVIVFSFSANATQIKTVQANGVTAWVVEDHLLPIVSIELAFKRAGGAYDPKEKMGLSYAVASMLNEGAGQYSSNDFQKLLEENAIQFEPDTDKDVFYLEVNTLSENLPTAIDLMSAALTEPKFTSEDFARVRGQIVTEIHTNMESAGHIGSEAFYKTMYPNHPYSQVKEGNIDTVSNITPEDMHKFVGENFARDNLMVAIVGDVDQEKATEILDSLTKGLKEKSAAPNLPLPAALPKASVTKIKMDNPQTTVIFGEAGIPRSDRDYYAAYLLNYIIGGGGFGTRLMTEVREKNGLAYSIGTRLQDYNKADLMLGAVSTRNEGVDKTIKLIQQEYDKLANVGVTQAELQAAKDYVTGSFGLNMDKNQNLAQFLITMQLYNLGIDYLDKRNNYFRNVTLNQVNDVAKRLVKPDKLVFVRVGK